MTTFETAMLIYLIVWSIVAGVLFGLLVFTSDYRRDKRELLGHLAVSVLVGVLWLPLLIATTWSETRNHLTAVKLVRRER